MATTLYLLSFLCDLGTFVSLTSMGFSIIVYDGRLIGVSGLYALFFLTMMICVNHVEHDIITTHRRKKKNNTKNSTKNVTIILSPLTRCSPSATNIVPDYDYGTIMLTDTTEAVLQPGFTFNFESHDDIISIGSIQYEYDYDVRKVLIPQGTPHCSLRKEDRFTRNTENDEYCYLELGSSIILPKGTIINDGKYEFLTLKDYTIHPN